MSNPKSKPRLRVPAEWEPQSCIWLAWPHNLNTWPGRFDPIPKFFARWVAMIADSTPVRILASIAMVAECKASIGKINNVEIIHIPTNDCWIRDYGPTFVMGDSGQLIQAVSWRYNAWGGKHAPWDDDDAVATLICEHQSIACINSSLCLEGGAVEADGRGRLITTPECLVSETRNPGWSTQQVEQELRNQLGATEVLWLTGGGLVGDDTDGHIDQLARFIDRQNIVAAVCDNKDDENHQPLSENFDQLQRWGESTSPSVTIHPLPIPPARSIDGQRIPESYCNFLRLGPDRLLMPTFAAKTDEPATRVLHQLTGLQIETIDCQDLAWGLGALHCASRDQPSSTETRDSVK